MTYLPENDNENKGFKYVLDWLLYVAVFLFAAWVIVQFMQFWGIIPQ